MRRYMIGSGYFRRNPGDDPESFYKIWWHNKVKYAKPWRIIIIAAGSHCVSPRTLRECPADWIHLDGDLGHVHHINSGQKPFHYSGFTMTLLTLCLLAYQDECDLFFCEQDMLVFGPWVETIHEDAGGAQMIYGTGKTMPCFQSLMLIKHEYLPQFVHTYLGQGSERFKENEGERKHERLVAQYPNDYKTFSFGYDRDRPFNVTDPVFYLQQITGDELTLLRDTGLLT